MVLKGYRKYRWQLSTLIAIGLLLLISIWTGPVGASTSAEYVDILKLQHVEDVVNQYDVVNISLTIINIYDESLRNMSFVDEYDNDIMFVQDSMNKSIQYNESTSTVSYEWDIVPPGETVRFWTILNFTANSSIDKINIQPTNISFYVDNGVKTVVYSNPLTIIYDYNPGEITGVESKTRIAGSLDLGLTIPIAGIFLPVAIATFAYVIGRKRVK
ncbi:MAG: hypothetical protein ACTSP4_02410 [Candidatus Hodarchaeales archaeon]